jgi:uncharacterized membrane protein YccC
MDKNTKRILYVFGMLIGGIGVTANIANFFKYDWSFPDNLIPVVGALFGLLSAVIFLNGFIKTFKK